MSPISSPAPAPPPKPSLCDRIWAWCGRSATLAWAYFLIAAGITLDVLAVVMAFLNAPEVTAAITAYGGPHASHWLKAIGVITAVARLRSLSKGESL